jgi:outer membrane receptor protein involved in Fe transport
MVLVSRSARPPVAAVLLAAGFAVPAASLAQVEEIVVTARKKEESLQQVPISISAFGEEQLRQQGLLNDKDVADFTVNFNTLPTTGRDYDRPVIRGMAGPITRGEANASYFIDGAYVSGSIAAATTSAVERVEILRGPQSTQFGRATFAGAVNYVTKSPTDELEGQVNTRAGSREDYNVGGWLSGPVAGDQLGFLLSANWSKYGGQWHNNLQEGQATNQPPGAWITDPPTRGHHGRLGAEETLDLLVKLVWTPVADGTLTFKYGYTEADDSAFPSLVPAGGPADVYGQLNCWLAPQEFYDYLAAGNTAPFPGEQPWWRTSGGTHCGELDATGYENRVNLPDFEDGINLDTDPEREIFAAEPGLFKNQNRFLLDYEQGIGDWAATVRGAYNDEDFRQVFDLDHTETRSVFNLFNFDLLRHYHDWSGEVRVASPARLPVRLQAGAYFYERSLWSTQRSFPGPAVVFGTAAPNFGGKTYRDVRNEAVFGGVEWDVTDALTVTLEGRWASDELDILGGNGVPDSQDTDTVTPRLSAVFAATDDVNLYAQVAKGNKPGDFNTDLFRSDLGPGVTRCLQDEGLTRVDEENQWTYEVGAKTFWLDRRLLANLAIFYIDWEDQSVYRIIDTSVCGGAVVTTGLANVGTSRNVGGELETTFAVTDELTLVANYGYSNAKFEEGEDSELRNLTGDGDVSGRWIPSAPEHSVVLGAVVQKPLGNGWTALFRTDLAYESRRYVDPANFVWIGDRTLVNLRAGVDTGTWNVAGYVRNLMDDETPLAALTFVNFGYGPLAPGADAVFGTSDDLYPAMLSTNPQRGREYGLEIQYRFGAR